MNDKNSIQSILTRLYRLFRVVSSIDIRVLSAITGVISSASTLMLVMNLHTHSAELVTRDRNDLPRELLQWAMSDLELHRVVTHYPENSTRIKEAINYRNNRVPGKLVIEASQYQFTPTGYGLYYIHEH